VRVFLFTALLAALITTVGCGGSSHSGSSGSSSTSGSGQNVQPITVDSGPLNNYVNGVFTNVTVCIPGSSNCQTIDHVLVDTGSMGLRLLSSVVTLSLPQENATNAALAECAQFSDGITWGSVRMADVKLAGEQASNIPIQLIGDPAFPNVPASCSSNGAPEDTLQKLLAKGILGVGLFRQDCGPGCVPGTTSNPGVYYACPSSGCVVTVADLTQQVQNPVWMFSSDNNGVLIELPSVPPAGAPTLSGSMIFGIGTQSNNSLGGATVFALNSNADITTVFKGKSYSKSFIDSGSNGHFFLDSTTTGIPLCASPNNGFYCPTATQNLSATQQGSNGASNTVSFSIANADSLFSNSADFVFPELGGPNANTFDWGLPFFYGRNVFTAIEQQNTPAGPGPYWAY
jgi:Protein of unknown function (DUF3443)